MNSFEPGTIQLVLFLAFLIPPILFLVTQQNTLRAIQPQNRLMSPGEVWLQMIPLFGMVWQFIVVTRISGSLKREFESWKNDSILGLPEAEAVQMLNRRPTYEIGIAYCILFCCSLIPLLGSIASMAGVVCWIIYWIKLAEYKRMVEKKNLH